MATLFRIGDGGSGCGCNLGALQGTIDNLVEAGFIRFDEAFLFREQSCHYEMESKNFHDCKCVILPSIAK
jgi:hypothetical protein